MKKFKTVREYMADMPETARTGLEELRKAVLQAVPKAEEGISYNIPVVRRNGEIVVWYAGFKKHLSLSRKRLRLPHSRKS